MKTFKTVEWDVDTLENNSYQEEIFKVFKNNKNKKKKDQSVNIKVDEKRKDKKQKRKLKKLLNKKYEDLTSSGLGNAQPNIISLVKNKKKKKLPEENSFALVPEKSKRKQRVRLVNQHENRKKAEPKQSNNLENNIQTKIQFFSELNNSNNKGFNSLHKDLLKENKKQKRIKKNPKNTSEKQDLLDDTVVNSRKKNKFGGLEITEKLDKYKKRKEYLENLLSKNDKEPISKTAGFLHMKKKNKFQDKPKALLSQEQAKKDKPILSLRQKMMEKLRAARFRFLNEQIYTTSSKEAQKIFKSDPDAFTAYHEGYRQQVRSWPVNPLDVVIRSIKKMPKTHVVADFGCGDAKLANSVEQKVHSFDLVAADDTVVACDMAKVPLEGTSVDVAVFCLSLMGTNLQDYILEANRVLKIGGLLKIAEVESRFESVENFIEGVQRFGFKKTWKDLSHNLFYFIDFKKQNSVKNKKKLPTISLLPCLYKKR